MAGNAVDELINNLYEMIQDAWSVPLGGNCIIDREKALDLLDEMRANLPGDLKMAHEIVEKRNDILASAKKEQEAMQKQAEEYARQKINDHELTQEARKKAQEIVASAEARAREVVAAAAEYCDGAMKRTEDAMAQALGEVKQSRAQIKSLLREQH